MGGNMAEWISVKDRLPSENGVYGIYSNYGDEGLANYKCGEWQVQPYCYIKNVEAWGTMRGHVTHWMPLPDPPQQEQRTIVVDIHINGERIDVDSFAEMMKEAVRKALEPEKIGWEERQQALRRLKEEEEKE